MGFVVQEQGGEAEGGGGGTWWNGGGGGRGDSVYKHTSLLAWPINSKIKRHGAWLKLKRNEPLILNPKPLRPLSPRPIEGLNVNGHNA